MENKRRIIISVVSVLLGIIVGIGIVKIYENKSSKSSKDVIERGGNSESLLCVSLGEYNGLEISLVPSQEDIQTEIDYLLEEHTEYEHKKGIAQKNDLVYGTFEGYVDGEKIDSTCGSEYIQIGSGEWLPGFEDAVIGMKTGKTKIFPISVPEGTYGDETLDGKIVEFHLKLNYICGEPIIPKYNDEFVQEISDYNTTQEHRESIREKLAKENEEDKIEIVWSEVLENCEVDKYPKDKLEAAKKEVLQGYYDLATIYGMSHDEVFQSFGCADEEEFKETQLKSLAKSTAKDVLVAEAIAYKEKITYTEEEYEDLLEESYEEDKDSCDNKEQYEEENRNYLQNTALINKVKEWIDKHTKYTN